MFKQILPDKLLRDLEIREAICLQIPKEKTGEIKKLLREINLKYKINEKITYIKNIKNDYEEDKDNYAYGKYNRKYTEYEEIDISFIKRVKKLNEKDNLYMIGFEEVI
jgi:hypothetical protein